MASNVGLDILSKNLSYFSVPAAFLCALGPHVYAITSAQSIYDNRDPRTFKDKVAQTQTLDAASKSRITKAKQASENGFETVGFFAAAVVAGNQVGIEPRILNALTWGYVASRIAFNVAYVHMCQETSMSFLRSALWQGGAWTIVSIWISAGLKAMNAYVF
ncbi:Membrane associated eicosanoid/glutathione metabolism-like domain protein [Emericellopsis cladophorae]|uniref:Membrane associated eicosanoid/glutathione metabolism-like domain protein n=1 Tax=Emericellopsis cladophorae TaxID=2686198 RepID=A0A9P9Y983_9HYPO|nr:Membrane associated eicosanoid/glutathione metabolism-like domain protein [Emericellopsis cladophorae]KAI6785718.1 Membrane associated eicosanoid/glutathione metabolism-like domain protein [Emericellopsis cladophorae]